MCASAWTSAYSVFVFRLLLLQMVITMRIEGHCVADSNLASWWLANYCYTQWTFQREAANKIWIFRKKNIPKFYIEFMHLMS